MYRNPGPVNDFIAIIHRQIRLLHKELPHNCRLVICGDFNLDQRDETNLKLFDVMREEFSLFQRSKFVTHRDGGILDLFFYNKYATDSLNWFPTPYSDHFILISSI